MSGAQQRRETVQQLRAHGLSLRRSCALCHISRSSFRYRSRPARRLQNQRLAARLRAIARAHPRYGYRRAHALVCRESPGINVKRVHRLWRAAQLCVSVRRPRRRRKAWKETRPIEATHPNHVWTYDFIHDRCANGQRLKILTVTDEFTRESLAIEVATRIRAGEVLEVLQHIMTQRGAPAYRRSDNGPEFVAQAVQQWVQGQQVQTAYIAPGSPWQNGYGASFNGRLRDECLNLEWLGNLAEAKVVIGAWRRHYHQERPHSSLGYQTPHEFHLAYEQQRGSQLCGLSQIWSPTTNAILTV